MFKIDDEITPIVEAEVTYTIREMANVLDVEVSLLQSPVIAQYVANVLYANQMFVDEKFAFNDSEADMIAELREKVFLVNALSSD